MVQRFGLIVHCSTIADSLTKPGISPFLESHIFKHGGGGGAHPKKTSRYTKNKIGKLALVFLVFFGFLKFPNWHWFFLALVLARIQNWKLVFFCFFWVFLFFLA